LRKNCNFKGASVSQDPTLTLYSVATDDLSVLAALYGYAEPVMVLGRDAADDLAAELIALADVLSVACEPVATRLCA
jgi:hypothetical protein